MNTSSQINKIVLVGIYIEALGYMIENKKKPSECVIVSRLDDVIKLKGLPPPHVTIAVLPSAHDNGPFVTILTAIVSLGFSSNRFIKVD